MIRAPSSYSRLYAWHRAYLAGEAPAVHDGMPLQCGWYKTRASRNGPWTPVEIKVERDIDPDTGELTAPERMIPYEGETRLDPETVWERFAWLKPISREEHAHLVATWLNPPPPIDEVPVRPFVDLSATPMRP